ncbi:MAG TPA: recombinase family protein [Alphaproteobacteria bacterium]|nr:recombinase family protein [Alphaproteobacteria bacterium]
MANVRCAIYVRKSSEHGLDQEFNSLDNQEQAAKAYIMSQTFQGWEYIKTYSDAAISGGTMVRPALQEMLTDIRSGRIDCVLVYKIDRLSRSIFDFKSMMKEFDKHNCNLVSITQSFDTNSAMGKLTLNMLLSFAEFEREVAGERIRDKIRATKSKGMWVGGKPPMGYDIKFHKLVPNESEIPIVRKIFETYLESSSLSDCRLRLIEQGIYGKKWITEKGKTIGGNIMGVSILQRFLTNPIFLGKLPNKSSGDIFEGEHPEILDIELFNNVQEKLKNNNNRGDAVCKRAPSLLNNKIQTTSGTVFKNSSGRKGIKQYKYYRAGKHSIPMGHIDKIVSDTVRQFLDSDMNFLPSEKRLMFKQIKYTEAIINPMIDKIIYQDHKITIFINSDDLKYLDIFTDKNYMNAFNNQMENCYLTDDEKYIVIETEISIASTSSIIYKHQCGEKLIMTKSENNNTLVRALAYAWKYKREIENGMSVRKLATKMGRDHRTVYKYLNLCYMSPKIINTIMSGNAPATINLQTLFDIASKYEKFSEQEIEFYK